MLLDGAVTAAGLRQNSRLRNPPHRPYRSACKIQLKTTKILALQGRRTRSKAFVAFLEALKATSEVRKSFFVAFNASSEVRKGFFVAFLRLTQSRLSCLQQR